MSFKYILILFSFFHLYGHDITSREPTFLHNALAGSYFQFASITGESVTPKDTYVFLDEYFKLEPFWIKREIKATNDFIFSYFLRDNGNEEAKDIILLPFQKGDDFYFLSLDDRFHASTDTTSIRHLTNCFIQALCKTYANFLRIHCLLVTSCGSQNPSINKPSTMLRETVGTTGHCIYTCIKGKNGKYSLSIAEPSFFKNYSIATNINSNNIEGEISLMFHQLTNMNDCVLFSAIYLLYAIRGITPDTLTNSQVRKGFKGWIEVSNRFNSKPKSRISKFTGVWRTIVDVMLYAPNFTEGTFIACSVGVLYYVASKLIPYFFNRD